MCTCSLDQGNGLSKAEDIVEKICTGARIVLDYRKGQGCVNCDRNDQGSQDWNGYVT